MCVCVRARACCNTLEIIGYCLCFPRIFKIMCPTVLASLKVYQYHKHVIHALAFLFFLYFFNYFNLHFFG